MMQINSNSTPILSNSNLLVEKNPNSLLARIVPFQFTGFTKALQMSLKDQDMRLANAKSLFQEHGIEKNIETTFETLPRLYDGHLKFSSQHSEYIRQISINPNTGVKYPKQRIMTAMAQKSIAIATDELHPHQAFAQLHLTVLAQQNALSYIFPDIRALTLAKQLSSVLDAAPQAGVERHFANYYQRLLSELPDDELINLLQDSAYQEYHADFKTQLATHMKDGSFNPTTGPAAKIALDLGEKFSELKKPSEVFTQKKLAEYCARKEFAPAHHFAQQDGHSLQSFAQKLLSEHHASPS